MENNIEEIGSVQVFFRSRREMETSPFKRPWCTCG